MVRVGLAAPTFDCQAVVQGDLVQFGWHQVHEHKRLVLVFDSIERTSRAPGHLRALRVAGEQLGRLRTKLAVVCRDSLYEVLSWANRPCGKGGPGRLTFPLLVDSDGQLADSYDLVPEDGPPLWGLFLIDPDGIVREMTVSGLPLAASVDDLVRSIQASWCPAGLGAWN